MAGTAVSGRGWPVQLRFGWEAWPPHNKQQINRKCVWNWWRVGRGARGSREGLSPSLAAAPWEEGPALQGVSGLEPIELLGVRGAGTRDWMG